MTQYRFERGRLTPELEELHAELASIEIEERQSFAPELQAELESVHAELRKARPRRRPVLTATLQVAAAAAALAVVSVPGARASLVRLVTSAVSGSEQSQPTPRIATRFIPAAEDRPVFVPTAVSEPAGETEQTVSWASEPITSLAPDIRYPSLRSQEEARAIVKLHYPRQLQRRGVSGTVRLILWVDESGSVLDHEVVRSSGIARLDQAALAAAPKLRFTPARRQGEPVGTWVEFDVIFQPTSEFVIPERPVVADLSEPQVEADLGFEDDVLPPVMEGEGTPPPVVSRRGNGGIRALNW